MSQHSSELEAFPMLAKLNTYALVGIDGIPVEVEVDTSAGLPSLDRRGRG